MPLDDTAYSRGVAALAIAYVLFMYSGAVDFIPDRMGEAGVDVTRAIVYGFFALTLGLAPVMLLKHRPIRLGHWDLVLVCYAAALLGIMVYHLIATPQEGGLATKSFITAILHIWTLGFLFSAARAARATRLATVTVVFACGLFILAEVAAPSPGRGSGFYLNPNVAALALLLGSLGALPSLAPLWRLPFLAFVGVVVFATLSRSGIIAAATTWAAWLAVEWTTIRNSRRDYILGASIAVLVVAAGGLFFTLAGSKQFRHFAGKTAGPMFSDDLVSGPLPERSHPREDSATRTAPSPPGLGAPLTRQEAPIPRPEAPLTRQQAPIPRPEAPLPREVPPPRCESWTVVFEGLGRADACPWLRLERVERVQKHSSGEARAILNLRSVAAFMDAPFLGIGLEGAHGVQTHNAFLFFGIAYGALGLLLIPAFAVVLIDRLGGVRPALPFVVFLFVSSFFSHDVFLVYGLIAAWVIALSAGSPAHTRLRGRGPVGEFPLPSSAAGSSMRKL
jgi:hypothetical protein